MMFRRLRFINKNQRGFTVIELLVAIAISGLITSGLTLTIFQVFGGNARNSSEMIVIRQVQNAGHWISRDTLMAQVVTPAEAVTVSWDQRESGDLGDEDRLYFAFSDDGGSTWSDNIEAFRDDDPPSSYSYPIPGEYLTNNFMMRFFLDFNVSGEYAYIDNITISQGVFSDDCSNFIPNWDNGANWTILSGEFQGQGSGTTDDLTLTMTGSLDLSSYQGSSSGFPLILTWTDWEGAIHLVEYTITDGKIRRSHYVDGVPLVETLVAQYINSSQTSCQFSDGMLNLTITASIGGYKPASETRTYEITPRPS